MLKYVLILLLHTVCIRAGCDYSEYFSDFQGFHLETFSNFNIILNRRGQTIIPKEGSVSLYCAPGFQWDFVARYGRGNGERSEEIGPSLTIFCTEEEKARFVMKNGVTLVTADFFPENSITCKESVSFYAAKLDHCDYEGLRLGVNIKDIPTVVLELCHDIVKSEPIFAHYVLAHRSNVLEKQIDYNPSNVTTSDLIATAKMSLKQEILPEIVLDNNFTFFTPAAKHLLSKIDYKYNELTSSSLNSSLPNISLKYEFSHLISVPWWTPLRTGNWIVFENLLSKQLVKEKTYIIYAGKSHKAVFPDKFVCSWETEILTYDFDGYRKHIPLFIWNYIIPRNEDDHSEEFVLVAINSPFVNFSNNNSMVICEDICDRIPWLTPLQATRKASSFGYMFCCQPKDVYNILDGFPLGANLHQIILLAIRRQKLEYIKTQ